MKFNLMSKAIIFTTCLPSAFAADASQTTSLIANLLPLVAIVIFFYFIVIRPQQQEQTELKNIQANLKENQEILTASGFIGQIKKISEDWVQLETAPNTLMWIKRSQIQKVLPNGTMKHITKK